MRIIDQRRCGCAIDTEAQLVDPSGSERRAVLNSAVLIPRRVKGGEPRRIRAGRRPDVGNQSGAVIYGVARKQRMGTGKVVVHANHTMVLTSVAFIRGDQFAGPIAIVRAVRRRDQIEKRLYQRIDGNGGTSVGGAVRAG